MTHASWRKRAFSVANARAAGVSFSGGDEMQRAGVSARRPPASGPHDLERDLAVEVRVERPVDDPHPARADAAEVAVAVVGERTQALRVGPVRRGAVHLVHGAQRATQRVGERGMAARDLVRVHRLAALAPLADVRDDARDLVVGELAHASPSAPSTSARRASARP